VISSVVGALADAHPIRAISVITDEAFDERSTKAWLGAGCEPQHGNQICSEEIILLGHPEAVALIVSTVLGLLAADLPVDLWWRGGTPSGNPLFSAFARLADKIVVDSMRFGDGAAALDTVRRLLEYRRDRAGVVDLNWERTAPWRVALAACFDDPAVAQLLPSFTRASVNYAADGGGGARPTARALLVAGWLSSRVEQLRGKVRVKADVDGGIGVGRVQKMSLTSTQSRSTVELERRADPVGIEATATDAAGEQIRRWLFPTATLGEAELLHRCIDSPARDPLLEAALSSE
jgi:glucose-6-phosphate dehydrogenase assembly protein OpcA